MINKLTSYVKGKINKNAAHDRDYLHVFEIEFPREYRYHLKAYGNVSPSTVKAYVLNNTDL